MSSAQSESGRLPLPCTWQEASACQVCTIQGQLMCRYETRDMATFLMSLLPFAVTAIAGTIVAGYGWYLFVWLVYSVFFFFIWEARVLCSHCPMWAEEERVLHCHANHGVIKIWKYRPGPMSRSERLQFILGALIWFGFPMVFLLLGREYVLALITLATIASGVFTVRTTACRRCVQFSCPLNAVPKPVVDAYLERNPVLREAWEDAGYRLGG